MDEGVEEGEILVRDEGKSNASTRRTVETPMDPAAPPAKHTWAEWAWS
jgi:hypothetical protein